jgi:FMN phosphatase YigB (HAD superfamily)
MAIKAVFFDLYNTLARFEPPAVDIQLATCADLGISVTKEGLAQGYAHADEYMAQQEAIRPLIQRTREERRMFFGEYERRVLEGANVSLSAEEALDVFRLVQRQPLNLALFDDVVPTLDFLTRIRLIVGLITNINIGAGSPEPGITRVTASLGIDTYLNFTVTSQEVGTSKPHAPIFRAALQKAGVQPLEAMHVGDQYQSDVLGAKGAGIHPVLLDRGNFYTEFHECPRITNLLTLGELIASYD